MKQRLNPILRLVIMTVFMFSSLALLAQEDEEYRMEIGAGVGVTGYLGDFNSSLTSNLQPSATAVMRKTFNPYMGLKAQVGYGKMKGKAADANTYYPQLDGSKYEFDNTLVNVDLSYEYNFWPYGTGREYRGAKPLTPFIAIGLGGTFVKGKEKNVFTANIPIGVGVKYKVAPRVNLGIEWAMHFSLSDELDGIKDPYTIISNGAFKNTDCYHTLQVTLTYSFMPKCRTCHNDRY
ncbi:type IX secretion system protein PorG [Prevotella koreensis]